MLLENSLKKYKETSQAIKQIVNLIGLTGTIIFIFIMLNVFFGEIKDSNKNVEIKDSNKNVESVITEEINKVITSLPKGRLNFFEGSDGHQLSPSEYEAVCTNTKIVTQRAIMGANITNYKAKKLYKANSRKIAKYSVKWNSSSNQCFAEYTIRALEGVSDAITVSGEAKGFLKTSIDTRVYFLKNF